MDGVTGVVHKGNSGFGKTPEISQLWVAEGSKLKDKFKD